MTINTTARQTKPITAVLTQHNDNNRSGTNLNEIILNTSNVNPNQFGKLFSIPVDGQIYAQPLYLPDVEIQKIDKIEKHNIIYIVTMHNTVYAFDADNGQKLWSTNLGPSIPIPDPNTGDTLTVEVGIVSTPTISIKNNSIYVVSTNKDPNKGNLDDSAYSHRLYVLDIMNGGIVNSVLIAATSPMFSTKVDHIYENVKFNSRFQLQRSSLLLSNNRIYIAFASYADVAPSAHGWVISYDADTLEQIAVFNTTPNGTLGTIWQGGEGPSSDQDGNIYFVTGNGTFDGNNLTPTNPTPTEFGDCVVKLSPDLKLVDWFSPFNNAILNKYDIDLGSAGALLLPTIPQNNKDLLITGGKEGKMYLIDRNNMGHFNPNNDNQIEQSFYVSAYGYAIINGPVYYNDTNGLFIYFATLGSLKAYKTNSTGTLDTIPILQDVVDIDWYGGWMSITANNDKEGILWLSDHKNILHSFDASTLKELWNSNMNPSRDAITTTSKFCPPTIANGKVYQTTFDNELIVYGLIN